MSAIEEVLMCEGGSGTVSWSITIHFMFLNMLVLVIFILVITHRSVENIQLEIPHFRQLSITSSFHSSAHCITNKWPVMSEIGGLSQKG